MFFYASKAIFFLVQPSSLAVLALLSGLWLLRSGRVRSGRGAIAAGLGWLIVAGLLPVGNALILPLEQRFGSDPPNVGSGDDISGIIMLGGFEDGWVSAGHSALAVNEAAERLTETLRLARRLPHALVIFTGGVGEVLPSADASGPVRSYLTDVGIAPERIVIEKVSRNTHENATMTRDLLAAATARTGGAGKARRYLLVTSAYHMPRSVGVFRRAGFDVVPYPVDYRLKGAIDLLRPFGSIPDGLRRADLAAKEWVGLVAYRITGRTDALYPAPAAPAAHATR